MFIEFSKIEFNNYKTIRKGSLVLEGRDVTLIKGINNDKGGSNGAGKSTIANGLLWCLYDRTLVGKETEKEIVPKFIKAKEFEATGGCRVAVHLERDGVKYIIERHRKSPIHKNAAVVYKFNGYDSKDISKCTDKETNELIEDIIGADFHAFVHSNVFSFNNIEPFLMRNDKDKKELVLPTYLVEMFKGAYKKCGEKIKEVEETLSAIGNEILSDTITISQKNLAIDDVRKSIEARNKAVGQTQHKLEQGIAQVSKIKESISFHEKEVSRHQKEFNSLTKDEEVCMTALEGWSSRIFELAHLKDEIISIGKDINTEELKLEVHKKDNKIALVLEMEELSVTIDDKTKVYDELNSKLLAKKEQMRLEVETVSVLVAPKKAKIETQLVTLKSQEDKTNSRVVALNSKKTTLLSQQHEFITKYYNKECESCSHNKMKEFCDNNVEMLKVIENDITYFKHELSISAKNVENINQELNEIKQTEEACERAMSLTEELISNLSKEEFSLVRELCSLKERHSNIETKIGDINNSIEIIAEIELSISELRKDLKKVTTEVVLLKEQRPRHNSRRFTEIHNGITDNIKIVESRIQESFKFLHTQRVELSGVEATVLSLEESLSVKDNLDGKLIIIDEELKKLTYNKDHAMKRQNEFMSKLELLKFWKVGFSSAGIEGFMMDSIVNVMNGLIAKYLGYLSNNTIALNLVPDSTLKTGATRNKISEKVENDSGGTTYRTNSEGEKRIMDIAVLFSLKYIYEQITGTRYNILFLDEAFDTLDAVTCSLVVNLINTLDSITSIFVVSHIDSICLEFDSFINVIKTKGISEVISESSE